MFHFNYRTVLVLSGILVLFVFWVGIIHMIMHQHDDLIYAHEARLSDQISLPNETTLAVYVPPIEAPSLRNKASRATGTRVYFNTFQCDDPTQPIDVTRPHRIPLRYNMPRTYIASLSKRAKQLYTAETKVNLNITKDIIILNESQFFDEYRFRGVIVSIEKLGLPAIEKQHEDSGQILKLIIRSEDGIFYIVNEFYSGNHRADEIEELVGKEFQFPSALRDYTDVLNLFG